MLIEVDSPACLPLGLAKFGENKHCLLGLTVQHPPVQLFAQAHSKLQITGPRADKGYEQARRFLQHHQLAYQAEVEIELSAPNFVGLGSEAMLGLSLAKALSWVHGLPEEKRNPIAWAQSLNLPPENALEIYGFDRGGLLLVDIVPGTDNTLPALLRRHEIDHPEKEAWAFVFYFPNTPAGASPTLEAEQRLALWNAASFLSSESGRLIDEALWPAVESNDFDAFSHSLLSLHQLNLEALAQAGTPQQISPENEPILTLMRQSRAIACGQNLTGLSLYGLVQGGPASRELRQKIRNYVGYFGGTVMATITANRGVAETVRDENLAANKMIPLRLNLPQQ
jgi:predicted sugar kinase